MNPVAVPESLRLLAPAKINLHLRVGPPTPDGFHPLLSWMCTVALFDTLLLSRGTEPPSRVTTAAGSSSSPTPLVELSCDDPSVPCDASNLIAKTASVLAAAILRDDSEGKEQHLLTGEAGRNASPQSQPASPPATREGRDAESRANVGRTRRPQASDSIGAQGSGKDSGDLAATSVAPVETAPSTRLSTIKAVLQKRIPAGAGLGGGSSDGARAMLGLARLWIADASFDRNRLADLSAQCGSDLPFFFHGPSSACTGRGQFVRPVPAPTVARWAMLVLPSITMPTPAVYRKFDELNLGDPDRLAAEPNWTTWAKLPSMQLLPLLVNDLEAPAFALRPDLAALRQNIESQLHRPVRMSGSGSSLFTLFDSQEDAASAAVRTRETFAVQAVAAEVAPTIDDDLDNK